ncbi:caspase domain-containing protein [Mycena vulgaris]|nr:caspase domain-containing protein [Mycena vulgaris]
MTVAPLEVGDGSAPLGRALDVHRAQDSSSCLSLNDSVSVPPDVSHGLDSSGRALDVHLAQDPSSCASSITLNDPVSVPPPPDVGHGSDSLGRSPDVYLAHSSSCASSITHNDSVSVSPDLSPGWDSPGRAFDVHPAQDSSSCASSITLNDSEAEHKRALLIGIRNSKGYGELEGAHDDVHKMRAMLIDIYYYAPADITVLLDDEIDGHVQPTRDNILDAIKDFVKDVKAGDRLFFHYSGHSTQVPNSRSNSEEDGMDECMVPIEGADELIVDNELHLALVAPLPAGAHLVAVLDTCHSGSLLDLRHYRCNRVFVPWRYRGKRGSEPLQQLVVRRDAQYLSLSALSISPTVPLAPAPSPASLISVQRTASRAFAKESRRITLPLVTASAKAGWILLDAERCDSPVGRFAASADDDADAFASKDIGHGLGHLPSLFPRRARTYGFAPPPVRRDALFSRFSTSLNPRRRTMLPRANTPVAWILLEEGQRCDSPVGGFACSADEEADALESEDIRQSAGHLTPSFSGPGCTYAFAPPPGRRDTLPPRRSASLNPRRRTMLPRANTPVAWITLEEGQRCDSPVRRFPCDGWCRKRSADANDVKADVISIASSRDSQRAWEDVKDGERISMASLFVDIMRKDPNPTVKEMFSKVSHATYKMVQERHSQGKKYKHDRMQHEQKLVARIETLKREAAQPDFRLGDAYAARIANLNQALSNMRDLTYDMNGFQNPELASPHPLDISRPFLI